MRFFRMLGYGGALALLLLFIVTCGPWAIEYDVTGLLESNEPFARDATSSGKPLWWTAGGGPESRGGEPLRRWLRHARNATRPLSLESFESAWRLVEAADVSEDPDCAFALSLPFRTLCLAALWSDEAAPTRVCERLWDCVWWGRGTWRRRLSSESLRRHFAQLAAPFGGKAGEGTEEARFADLVVSLFARSVGSDVGAAEDAWFHRMMQKHLSDAVPSVTALSAGNRYWVAFEERTKRLVLEHFAESTRPTADSTEPPTVAWAAPQWIGLDVLSILHEISCTMWRAERASNAVTPPLLVFSGDSTTRAVFVRLVSLIRASQRGVVHAKHVEVSVHEDILYTVFPTYDELVLLPAYAHGEEYQLALEGVPWNTSFSRYLRQRDAAAASKGSTTEAPLFSMLFEFMPRGDDVRVSTRPILPDVVGVRQRHRALSAHEHSGVAFQYGGVGLWVSYLPADVNAFSRRFLHYARPIDPWRVVYRGSSYFHRPCSAAVEPFRAKAQAKSVARGMVHVIEAPSPIQSKVTEDNNHFLLRFNRQMAQIQDDPPCSKEEERVSGSSRTAGCRQGYFTIFDAGKLETLFPHITEDFLHTSCVVVLNKTSRSHPPLRLWKMTSDLVGTPSEPTDFFSNSPLRRWVQSALASFQELFLRHSTKTFRSARTPLPTDVAALYPLNVRTRGTHPWTGNCQQCVDPRTTVEAHTLLLYMVRRLSADQ